jgi:hypothetical protein
MKLTVQRRQEGTPNGVAFLVSFYVALRADEQDLVRLYDLHQFRIAGYTLHQLIQGVQYEGGSMATPVETQYWTTSVVRSEDALRKENEVRGGCQAFLTVLTHLRDYDEAQEYVFELPESTDEA